MMKINNNYGDLLKSKKLVDLFAGIGGFRLAFEPFGAECVFSSEWDRNAQNVYEANFKETPDGDITKIAEKEIPSHNILCAGFPCQAFSISGKKLGFEDTRGTLFFDVARIAKYHQPDVLFLENVKNFKNHNKGETLKTVIAVLDSIGYNTFHEILNSGYFGLPQKRERIYILAFRKDLKISEFQFPMPPMIPIKLKDIVLPDSETIEYRIERDDISIRENINVAIDIFGNYPLKPIRIGIINKGGQGERIYHECGHAITLSAYGGGAGAKTGVYLINGKVRKLAPRECARLMGFPDEFKIDESDYQAYKQLGNSVPVDVLQYIIMELIKQRILT